MKESQEHQAFSHWLDSQGLPYIHSRTDRRHTNALGDPDYYVMNAGKVLAIEFKVGQNKLSAAQEKRIAHLRKAGIRVQILASASEAISAVMEWAGVENASGGLPERQSKALETIEQEPLWVGNLLGIDYVFLGGSSPGSTAEKLRRATPQDIRDLPRK